MKAHTIVLAGNSSYSNRGCEAILRGTTAILRDQFGECRFISNYFPTPGSHDEKNEIDPAVIHRPFPILKRYSLAWIEEQISRKVFRQPYNSRQVSQVFHRSLREAEVVLMLGGDNFSLDYPNGDTHFKICRMAVEANVPLVIWGASVGPFTKDPAYEEWAAKELAKMDLICARETATVEYLDSIGVTKNVILTADPSFLLQPVASGLPVEIEKALQEGCIGLNLSPLLSRYVKINDSVSSLTAWMAVAVEIVQNLLQDVPMPILLIPHVTSEDGYTGRDDYLFLKSLAESLNEPQRVFLLGPDLNAAQLKWVISRVRAFAGARTHSTLAAISTCVPTICIGYSMKATGIARDVYNHLDWLIPGQDLVEDRTILKDRFITLLSQEAEIRDHLEHKKAEFVSLAKSAAEHVKDLLC